MDDVWSGFEGRVCLVVGVEQENGVDEDDEVNGDDRGYRSTAVFWIGWR